MRPPRIALLALFSAACLFLLSRAVTSTGRPAPVISAPHSTDKATFRSFLSFHTPFTLFSPNAIITIADDNTTSFAARPAFFGPSLPAKGLSGQLWIGGSFTEEALQDGEGDGELGCSDIPGWHRQTSTTTVFMSSVKEGLDYTNSDSINSQVGNSESGDPKGPLVDRRAPSNTETKSKPQSADDGTDDYLQRTPQKLPSDAFASLSSSHADIQSLQEGAEITGKIVLLNRGGCGFLEKVKWAQRRGATGLIVGDNQRGAPLIQMYAHGDTSNVTIPSIFTSRTTAYLLSLMIQPGNFAKDIPEGNGQHASKVPSTENSSRQEKLKRSGPGYLTFGSQGSPDTSTKHSSAISRTSESRRGVLGRLLKPSNFEPRHPFDDFRIGVDDWRDPDLVGTGKIRSSDVDTDKSSQFGDSSTSVSNADDAHGPTSRYAAEHMPVKGEDAIGSVQGKSPTTKGNGGFVTKMFLNRDSTDTAEGVENTDSVDSPIEKPAPGLKRPSPSEEREGLWVVITPSNGASPFFDTLLVLVISPLITLTVVYALLILRARIRRRRWRAPKSVVERLPVRTYHTVASTPSRTSRVPSPTSSSPTTPLLQSQNSQNCASRPRPRSRTPTAIPSSDNLLTVDDPSILPQSPSRAEHEKRKSTRSEWKKYMGRQVECVVCLEEYVDGVSQVMSLPCGHEFHVECITPWLTTRRRTCPICKGDVVRSLARGSPSSPRYEPYRDDSEDDNMAYRSTDSSQLETASSRDREDDVEQGLQSPSYHQSDQQSWLSTLSLNIRDRFSRQGEGSNDTDRGDRDR